MTDHWHECWRLESHPACRLAEIVRLQTEVYALRIERIVEGLPSRTVTLEAEGFEPVTVEVPVLTHAVVLPLHGEGPTWAHKVCDEPPSQ